MVSMGVLSDDFAAVDFREDYANLSLPKEAKFKRCRTIKTNERKPCAAEKRQPVPQRVSGDGFAPPRFRFGFPFCSCCLFRGVCLAAARDASRTCLCQAHAMVPNRLFDDKIGKNYFLFVQISNMECLGNIASNDNQTIS